MIHTVDSARLAERLQQAAHTAQPLPVLIEVKLSEEPAKTGVAESGVEELAGLIRRLDRLELRGLMTMPPWSEDPETSRPYFRRLREIGRRLGTQELSMGMTNDFEAAIEEGSTIVRVGTAIFGKREKQELATEGTEGTER
jgi:pyridoxal phosphate enzyme (YggS family)